MNDETEKKDEDLEDFEAEGQTAEQWRQLPYTVKCRKTLEKSRVELLKQLGKTALLSSDPKIQHLGGRLVQLEAEIIVFGGRKY